MIELILIVLGLIVAFFGVMLFLGLIAATLGIGTIGGAAVGLFYGCRNYFSSLRDEIKLRK